MEQCTAALLMIPQIRGRFCSHSSQSWVDRIWRGHKPIMRRS